ncbi:unnamed protein product [Somion occarium]|uniref:Mitochondrial carrier protein n=1 Tax=Somion occarium TaxID=3059160 RepID=A0ABP1CPB3_9APHY
MKPETTWSEVDHTFRLLLAGALAGGIAKTTIAPLDRVKILFQTHHSEYAKYMNSWRGVMNALAHILRTQGFLGLYRGHSLTLARTVPYAAIGYTMYDSMRKVLVPRPEYDTYGRRMLIGSITGMSMLPFVYPFELVRVRMAIETKHSRLRLHIWPVIKLIYREPTRHEHIFGHIRHFYRGFVITALGTIPYRGGVFLVLQTLDGWCQEHLSPESRRSYFHAINLANGGIAGTTAQAITYPLEVIRRNQQASGGFGYSEPLNFRDAARLIWKAGGWRGFYAGLGIGLVKQVPLHSISWAVWHAAKRFLHV